MFANVVFSKWIGFRWGPTTTRLGSEPLEDNKVLGSSEQSSAAPWSLQSTITLFVNYAFETTPKCSREKKSM